MEEIKIAEKIYNSIEVKGLIETIKEYFGAGAIVKMPFSEKTCGAEIENLNLSVRSHNCLKRVGLNTVDKVICAIEKDDLLKIRNLGKNSRAEIRVRTCEFGYNSLSERGRKNFSKILYEENKELYKQG